MYPRPFAYLRPRDVRQAIDALARYGTEASVLAGGMSLVPMLKYRERSPRVLVDIARLGELSGVATDGRVLRLGATTRHHQVVTSASAAAAAALPELAARIGDTQVRNMGTVGGALAAVEPTGDWGAMALAMRGELVAVSARRSRRVPADDFFVDTRRNALDADELLTEVRLPLPDGAFGTAFAKFEARAGAALISCAGCVELAGRRVVRAGLACVGVRGRPVRLPGAERSLLGESPTAELVEATTDLARAEVGGGFPGGVVGSLVRDVLRRAVERAQGATVEVAG